MRILHTPLEIAGQAALSAAGLREIGHDARTLLMPHAFDYADDTALPRWGRSRRLRTLQRVATAPWAAAHFDVLHFHNGTSMVPFARYVDARAARRLGHRAVVEFWGADCRLPSVERARNPWYVPSPNDDDERNVARMAAWAEVTSGHVVVADHFADDFLAPHFDHVHVVGQRVDLRARRAVAPDPAEREPVVLHVPSNLAVKGTAEVRAAVEELERRGRSFRYVEMSGVPAHRVAEVVTGADIVVDQLRLGSHGVFSVEAMASAKPVVCHISEQMRAAYPPELPVVDADPSSITEVLDDLLHDGGRRRRLGLAGRVYAEQHHSHVVVARRLEEAYRRLPGRTPSG